MFRLIKLDFYDEFACLMSECPDNCCDEDWDIYIDDATIERYEKMGIPDLWSKITAEEPHRLIKKDHKCPFITPEGLCSFHRDYGEEYLSNTCRSYPRFASTYGDVYLETLGMSCPATVRHVIGCTSPVSFPDRIYYEDRSEAGRTIGMTDTEKLARAIISCFGPGQSPIETYHALLKEFKCAPEFASRQKLVAILREISENTPSERYVKDLFDEMKDEADCGISADADEELMNAEKILGRGRGCFAANVNRILLFEHLMLHSKNEAPDPAGVIIEGMIAYLLLLAAFAISLKDRQDADDELIIDRTYRLMRVIDHSQGVLKKAREMMKNQP